MKILSVFVIFLYVNLKCTNQLQTDSTLAVQDRVALLKLQIAQEIKKNQFGHEKLYPIDNHDFGASYEYEDVNKRITPIMDFDERKKHDKFKMRKIKTTTEKEIEAFPKKFHVKKSRKRERPRSADTKDGNLEDKSPKKGYGYSSDESSSKEKVVLRGIEAAFSETKRKPIQGRFSTRPILAKNEHDDDEAGNIARHSNNSISSLIQPLIVDRQKHKRKHKNIFYRRNFFSTKHIRPEWIHCQDLVTPFLKGDKTNMTQGRQLSHGDNAVRRLLQLLSEDTSDDTLEDIFSLIYQISNLQIRLFQWDTPALKTLLNVISREPRKVHTFRTLKAALKKMFDSWHLDLFGNTTNLLKQSRLYRPPCIRITPYEGSTKTSKGVRYSKSLRVQSTKDEDDANDDEDC